MQKKGLTIADNIRRLRENLGFSQDYVASKLGVTQQTYSNIEKNPERTSLKNLRELAVVFNVSIGTIIMEDEQFIQQNFNHQHCNIASQLSISSSEIYEKLIKKMEDEINFLRESLRNTNNQNALS